MKVILLVPHHVLAENWKDLLKGFRLLYYFQGNLLIELSIPYPFTQFYQLTVL